jgi:hypothetical protein
MSIKICSLGPEGLYPAYASCKNLNYPSSPNSNQFALPNTSARILNIWRHHQMQIFDTQVMTNVTLGPEDHFLDCSMCQMFWSHNRSTFRVSVKRDLGCDTANTEHRSLGPEGPHSDSKGCQKCTWTWYGRDWDDHYHEQSDAYSSQYLCTMHLICEPEGANICSIVEMHRRCHAWARNSFPQPRGIPVCIRLVSKLVTRGDG